MLPKLIAGTPGIAPAATPEPSSQSAAQRSDHQERPADAVGSSLPDALRQSRPRRTRSSSTSAVAAPHPSLSSDDLALAAYLLARDIDGRRVFQPEMDRLRKANESVGNTRRVLKFGRGNVGTDLRATGNESRFRTKAARQLKAELYMRGGGRFVAYAEQMQHSTTAATVLGSGNCGEYTSVTSIRHSSRLDAGETVHYVTSAGHGHAWAEERVPADDVSGASTIVMDGWAKGPAVLAPDSRFAANRGQVESQVQLDAATGREARVATNDLILELRAKGPAETQRRVRQSTTWTARLAAVIDDALLPLGLGGHWAEQPVLSDAFAARVRARLTLTANADLLARAKRIATEFGVAVPESTAQAHRIISATLELIALR